MTTKLKLLACLLIAGGTTNAQHASLEINHRLQPDRDETTETSTSGTMSLRVVEDRGIIEKTGGRLSLTPLVMDTTERQSGRIITGKLGDDGSFSAEMHFNGKSTLIRQSDGTMREIPDRSRLKNVQVRAIVEADGRVRPGSIAISGPEQNHLDQIKTVFESVLAQAAGAQPMILTEGQSAPQEMSMRIPAPGIGDIGVTVRTVSRLIEIKNGKALVAQTYSFDFSAPNNVLEMKAEGNGEGLLVYDIKSRTTISNESSMKMSMTIRAANGTIEVESSDKTSSVTIVTAVPPA